MVCSSKESFLNEYRTALAERILKSLDFQLDKEVSYIHFTIFIALISIITVQMRNVELLKLRFGESSLHSCDIMLRDLRESRRLLNSMSDETTYWKNEKLEIVVCSKVSEQSFLFFGRLTFVLSDCVAETCRRKFCSSCGNEFHSGFLSKTF